MRSMTSRFAIAGVVLFSPIALAQSGGSQFRGVDDFFNVREANNNISGGQWQFELGTAWSTFQSDTGRDDDLTLTPSIKYAYTDKVHIEIGLLPLNFGDGKSIGLDDRNPLAGSSAAADRNAPRNGNGELSLKYFWQPFNEGENEIAMAFWTDVRIPTGSGSEKVDAAFNLGFTKTLVEGIRGHFQSFLLTANGSRGDLDQFGDRRDFQWGAGFGLDFAVDDSNTLVVNYVNRSSNFDGNANSNNYELGWVMNLSDSSFLALAGTYADHRGDNEGARWTGKVQWSMSW